MNYYYQFIDMTDDGGRVLALVINIHGPSADKQLSPWSRLHVKQF